MTSTIPTVTRTDDAAPALAIDRAHRGTDALAPYIARIAREGGLYLAAAGGRPSGYLCLEPAGFFRRPFVSWLIVDPSYRRSGTGGALLQTAEQAVTGRRLFISTNQSNSPMIALLRKRDYTPCGWVSGIDEGDPELFYHKDVR